MTAASTSRPPNWASEFLRNGMVVVEGALDRDFCETVIAARLADLGVVEEDRSTWRTGWHNTPATTAYPLESVAPKAAEALFEIVGDPETLKFHGLPDNLIVNFPDPTADWWPPERFDSPGSKWHKDGDWFRHYLDSPEQAMLGIVFWRDVTYRQGATYLAVDSIPAVARRLAAHPEGFEPPVPVADIVSACRDFRALTAPQGTIVWAHPFIVHSASVNATNSMRIISNTSVMKREPLRFSGPGPRTLLEKSVLAALNLSELEFEPTGQRSRVLSEREGRWRNDGKRVPR